MSQLACGHIPKSKFDCLKSTKFTMTSASASIHNVLDSSF